MAFTLACKSRALVVAETYEREACACRHHDLACARWARADFVDEPAEQPKWYERGDFARISALQKAGDACHARAVDCSAVDPCNADQRCVFDDKENRQRCVRVAREGERCNGFEEDLCEEGLDCWSDDPSCATHWKGGVCVRPSKP
jgi:hypothetical protein